MAAHLLLNALFPLLVHALPAWVALPDGVKAVPDSLVEEEWGEAAIPSSDADPTPLYRGHHWSAALSIKGVSDDAEGATAWKRLEPGLVRGGWTVVRTLEANPFSAVVRQQGKGRDAWALLTIASGSDVHLELVDVVPPPWKLSATAPAAVPEKVSETSGDFPYLPPLPGSHRMQGGRDRRDFLVQVPGDEEAQVVASWAIQKTYIRHGTSNVQFASAYRTALTEAGWNIVVDAQGPNLGDAMLMVHFARNGRDIWVELHHANGEYTMRVADTGAEDLAARLTKDCHVPLYGVFFDFDKATLRPESEAVLARARDALQSNAGLAVEVQGHTDNTGTDVHNQSLSESRARAVVEWLVRGGIAKERLAAKGYGRGNPVATNETPEGRARNRRVGLACRK